MEIKGRVYIYINCSGYRRWSFCRRFDAGGGKRLGKVFEMMSRKLIGMEDAFFFVWYDKSGMR